jgi:hypothetical protein
MKYPPKGVDMSFKYLATTFLVSAAVISSSLAFASGKHDHKPKHGGVVVEVKDMDFELVAKPELVQLYLRSHHKSPNLNKTSAKITFLTGADKQEVELTPVGDRLEAKGPFKVTSGTKAIALVTIDGKSSTARFVLK